MTPPQGTRDADRKRYLPYCALSALVGTARNPVTLHWFCAERPEPTEDYSKLILGYQGLTPEAKVRAERLVDELFREDEFHLLRTFLEQHFNAHVRTAMLTTPLTSVKPDTGTRLGTLRPFSLISAEHEGEVAVLRLSEVAGYSLPFAVHGAYLSSGRPSHHAAPG